MKNNDVFQVLVPIGVEVAEKTSLDALPEGFIGAFSYDTNETVNTKTNNFYLAMKVKNSDGVLDIVKSAGTHIQGKGVTSFAEKCYAPAVEMVTSNKMKVIQCGGEIGVKIEIRNQEAYRLNGFNQVVQNWVVPTSECVDCNTDCEDAKCSSILDNLVALINSDPDAVVVASKSDAGDCVTGVKKLILTVNPKALKDWCQINLGYFYPNQTQIVVTPLSGFEATVVETDMQYEQGEGYDIKQLESEAGGWNGKPGPYRVSELVGTASGDFQTFAKVGTKYDVIQLGGDNKSTSGWRSDEFPLRTIIAVENGLETGASTGGIVLLSGAIADLLNKVLGDNADPIELTGCFSGVVAP